jgi:ABC-type Fe3+-hydroxamate transport system substrate-binding protein
MDKKMIDQIGREVNFIFPPRKIVSLVPSQTELLIDLGLGKNVVGITTFCVHPDGLKKEKTIVGGTKTLDIQKIIDLKPDLIFANKEENVQAQIEELAQIFPVWLSDIVTFESALDMIVSIGDCCDKVLEANILCNEIVFKSKEYQPRFDAFFQGKKVAYFIWRKPYMVAANETYIGEMLKKLGFCNIFSEKVRYPIITEEMLAKAEPDFIFLSSEPFPFKEKHIAEFQKICPQAQIKIVDGEMFSWYGSRISKAFDYFRTDLIE